VVEGEGVFTLVDGDPLHMGTGDLILTPGWTFHEHHNPTPNPMTWIDVLDLPLVAALDSIFFEEGPSEEAGTATVPRSDSESWYGTGAASSRGGSRTPAAPLAATCLSLADSDRALGAQLDVSGGTHARLRYTDPVRGGDVMPTMRCEIDRVLAGSTTDLVRQTGGRVATVLHGTGTVRIGAERYRVEHGDILAIPSWHPWSITAETEMTCSAPATHQSSRPSGSSVAALRPRKARDEHDLPTLVVGAASAASPPRCRLPGPVARASARASGRVRRDRGGSPVRPECQRALDALDVLDDILPLAVQPARAVLRDALSGRVHTILELGPLFRERYGYRTWYSTAATCSTCCWHTVAPTR